VRVTNLGSSRCSTQDAAKRARRGFDHGIVSTLAELGRDGGTKNWASTSDKRAAWHPRVAPAVGAEAEEALVYQYSEEGGQLLLL
jgi:hypothetical protein